MLQSGVASARAHCEAAAALPDRTTASAHVMPTAHPASHLADESVPAPSAPERQQDIPECCVALGSCAIGSFIVSSDDERHVSLIADRIGEGITAVPASLQPPPDPPPPRG
jgi:hypothetical protein